MGQQSGMYLKGQQRASHCWMAESTNKAGITKATRLNTHVGWWLRRVLLWSYWLLRYWDMTWQRLIFCITNESKLRYHRSTSIDRKGIHWTKRCTIIPASYKHFVSRVFVSKMFCCLVWQKTQHPRTIQSNFVSTSEHDIDVFPYWVTNKGCSFPWLVLFITSRLQVM